MNRYKIEHNGKIYTVEAGTDEEARALVEKDAPPKVAAPSQSREAQIQAEFADKPWYSKAGQAADDIVRLIANGATFGYADKFAGMMNGDVGAERQASQDARTRAGSAGVAAEIGGGVATGLGAAGAGLTGARFIPSALSGARRMGALSAAGAVDGAAMGALSGAGHTDDGDYMRRMANQAGIGAAVGGAAPAVIAGIGKVAAPFYNAAVAKFAPETFARRIAGGAIESSGRDVGSIRQSLQGAADDGQGAVYTVADAMGPAGGRALNGVARGNSEPAMRVKEALDARQTGAGTVPSQAGRIEDYIREGFGAKGTAKQLQDKLEGVRREGAAKEYAPVMNDLSAIDVSPAVAAANKLISPLADNLAKTHKAGPTDLLSRRTVEKGEAAIRDPIRESIKDARSYLAAENQTVVNVAKAFRAKNNIDEMINNAVTKKQGARAEALGEVQAPLDASLASTSPVYAKARNAYANRSTAIEGIDTGKDLARRGVSQDTAEAFARMHPQEAGAARVGYADTIIERLQRSAEGVNGARPLSSEKFVNDLPAAARPGRAEKLQRQIDREGEMFATRGTVTGGSQTANNLADIMALGTAGGAYGAGSGLDLLGVGHGYGATGGGTLAALLMAKRGYKALNKISPSDASRASLAKALMSNSADDIAVMAAKNAGKRELSESSVRALVRALTLTGVSDSHSR